MNILKKCFKRENKQEKETSFEEEMADLTKRMRHLQESIEEQQKRARRIFSLYVETLM
ncbi:hypothetical protein HCB45_14235 [Listeria sp. FSL L7-0091]|uniref:hypothetical protein n=1 Tax=Listeria farberi TaxID=2713500 RepID=UPI001624C5E6|nr:hypothetical protein [Listeria farberi]MBC2262717.1 hypothetical protein [Listeria farberi]